MQHGDMHRRHKYRVLSWHSAPFILLGTAWYLRPSGKIFLIPGPIPAHATSAFYLPLVRAPGLLKLMRKNAEDSCSTTMTCSDCTSTG